MYGVLHVALHCGDGAHRTVVETSSGARASLDPHRGMSGAASVRVAIDGPDAAGKPTLADELAGLLERGGKR